MIDFLKLMRISALPTLWSNNLTAMWLGYTTCSDSLFRPESGIVPILNILLCSSFLYLAGMVLNDFFDAGIDSRERPERVIPAGRISRFSAGIFGFALLLGGLVCLEASHRISENATVYYMGVLLTGCILGYDAGLKRIPFLGPIVMGACRFFNIGLVLASCGCLKEFAEIMPFHDGRVQWIFSYPWFVGVYVAALTILSRYEAGSPKIQRMVGAALAMLIPIDATVCLVFLGPVPALAVIWLYPVSMALKKLVPMS